MEEESCAALVSHFQWPDYLVCALMLLVSAAIGVFYALRQKAASADEILMGGRQMGTFPMAMSLLASFMSAITLLGNPSEMYNYGTQFMMIGVVYLLITPIAAYLFMPVFHQLRLTSAYEYLEMRFNRPVRLFGSLIFVIHMVLYMPIVVYAPALAINQVTGINTFAAVTAIFVVCIFYTAIGGIKAVMWTDTFQVLVMFVAMSAVVLRGNYLVGGFAAVWEATKKSNRAEFFNFDFDPRTRHTFWNMVIGCTFLWSIFYSANQAQIQRYLTVPTIAQAKKALWINCVGLVALLLICCWGGLVIYTKYATCDPLSAGLIKASDQLLPLFVMDTMGDLPGVPGLFVAGISSSSLSTVSTGLSALAAITLKDFIGGVFKIKLDDRREALWAKWISVAYGALCLLLVFVVAELGAVLQAAFSIHGIVGGSILGVFSLGIFVPWANSKGAMTGAICGLLVVAWIGFGAQLANARGTLRYPIKPISTVDCNCTVAAASVIASKMHLPEIPNVSLPYSISYAWYTAIGWSTTMIVGTAVSYFTGFSKLKDVDVQLLSPATVWVLDRCSPTVQKSLKWKARAERDKKEPATQVDIQLSSLK